MFTGGIGRIVVQAEIGQFHDSNRSSRHRLLKLPERPQCSQDTTSEEVKRELYTA